MTAIERFGPWWGLLVVPTVFLAGLSAAYALVPLACRTGAYALVHLAPGAEFVVEVLGVVVSAWCVMRVRRAAASVPEERSFLATVSLATAILFLAATLVQWYVAAVLSPCLH